MAKTTIGTAGVPLLVALAAAIVLTTAPSWRSGSLQARVGAEDEPALPAASAADLSESAWMDGGRVEADQGREPPVLARSPGRGEAAEPTADAGDDQIAVVGSRVTLNGAASRPAGRVGYRWIQVGGPRPRVQLEQGAYFSFVPVAPGVYRFALVVAVDSRVSAPDEVAVTVGAIASSIGVDDRGGGVAGGGGGGGGGGEFEPLDRIARRALGLVHPGAETTDELVAIFRDIAQKMDLYENYGETFRELSQRLEPIVGATPARRATWTDRVFNPLAVGLVKAMREEGLDLGRPEGQSTPLNQAQRAHLAEQFRLIAEGFQAAGGRPSNSNAMVLPPITTSETGTGMEPRPSSREGG